MEKETLSNKVRLEYLTLDIEEDIETEEELVLIKDVKEFINQVKNHIIAKQGLSDFVLNGNEIIERIDELAGDELI